MSESDLRAKLTEWVEKQGFPLEMRVAHVLAEAGITSAHSRFYEDPEEGIQREIDLVAFLDHPAPGVSFHLTIECKATTKPWVLFSTKQLPLTASGHVLNLPSSAAAQTLMREIANRPEAHALPLFRRPERLGFNLVQAFSDHGPDVGHRAMMAAAKSAATFARWITNTMKPSTAIVFVPVIVVSSSLFEARLDAEGELSLEQIHAGVLLRRDVPTLIHVVTESGLALFRDGCLETARRVQGLFSPQS